MGDASLDLFLQIWGGAFFLLNKFLFAVAERIQGTWSSRSRIAGWAFYITGLPPWIIILCDKRDWIAAALELGGVPAMLLGLYLAIRGIDTKTPSWTDGLVKVCIVLGIGGSLWDHKGLTLYSQWLEAGLATGYLIGTYLLARQRPVGYLWYVLMHLCCGFLMWMQHYPWLALQQAVSLVFIITAYRATRRAK
jgi:hypothetical protein